jgi:hypothetical protein
MITLPESDPRPDKGAAIFGTPMKESFYFSHDYNPTSDPKISSLISEYGASGYGVYWHIIELMHQDDTHKLPLKQYLFEAIAKQMQASAKQNLANSQQNILLPEHVEALIKYCIMVCELFVVDGDFFYSNRVISNFENRSKLSEKRSLAGKNGAIAKQMQASAKQNLAKPSKGKEKKGKEIKEKLFIAPTFEEFFEYCKENGFSGIAERAFKGYSAADWHDAKGNKILVWKQKLQNGWFKTENADAQENLFPSFNFKQPKRHPENNDD